MAKNDDAHQAYVAGKLKMNEGDYKAMVPLFLKAISLGHVSAMNDLAFYHQYVTKHKDSVVKYYTMAIEQGKNPNSAFNLSCFYHEQADVVNQMKWLKVAADQFGDTRALFSMGVMLEGHEKKPEEALTYYRLAWQKGKAQAGIAIVDILLSAPGRETEAKTVLFEALRSKAEGDFAYYFDDKRLVSLTPEERKESFFLIAERCGLDKSKLVAMATTCRNGDLASSLMLPGCNYFSVRTVLNELLAASSCGKSVS